MSLLRDEYVASKKGDIELHMESDDSNESNGKLCNSSTLISHSLDQEGTNNENRKLRHSDEKKKGQLNTGSDDLCETKEEDQSIQSYYSDSHSEASARRAPETMLTWCKDGDKGIFCNLMEKSNNYPPAGVPVCLNGYVMYLAELISSTTKSERPLNLQDWCPVCQSVVLNMDDPVAMKAHAQNIFNLNMFLRSKKALTPYGKAEVTLRSGCPLCRIVSANIATCAYWIDDKTEKEKYMKAHFSFLRRVIEKSCPACRSAQGIFSAGF